MKIKVMAVLLLLTSLTFVSLATASPKHRYDYTSKSCRDLTNPQLEWASRPWGEGGKLFREVCKKCHSRDNSEGAKFLHVESKTSKGWNRVFAQHKVKCAKDGQWESMTLDQQLKLNDYLYRFAAYSQDKNDSA
ncbi:MAG: hypothetical protein OEY01_02040 [Desulfobulbaceae bacterium]|nr:hypothetical protein [Desulfobulbaceae bacterium]HIJ78073.1 hypothetical protein [Deltaproteobacteria bacterium]